MIKEQINKDFMTAFRSEYGSMIATGPNASSQFNGSEGWTFASNVG